MWKTLSDWLFAVFNMSRELQEQRHARELESTEREKLLLRLQSEVTKLKELPPPRGRKNH